MSVLILLIALGLLMFGAYRGVSVILAAPVCALLAVGFTLGPQALFPVFSGVFMEAMVRFVAQYLPVFLLGALFGKLMELTGAAASISSWIVNVLGERHTIGAVVLACAILTYGGVSLFVVAFAVYPFAKALFKQAKIAECLIPGTIALGSFTFTMDALPGTPQIQNVIPTTFFGTNLYAAPILGCVGASFVLVSGMLYMQRRKHVLGEQEWGATDKEEIVPVESPQASLPGPLLACLPLVTVGLVNFFFTRFIHSTGLQTISLPSLGLDPRSLPPGVALDIPIAKLTALYAIEVALLAGIAVAILIGRKKIWGKLRKGSELAVGGAMLAALNTGSEYGFGAVIAAMPGFMVVKSTLSQTFANPLINEAISVNVLAGITGSASGGMSIALAAMAENFKQAALASGIPFEVLHRVASMASGGMDTLPHNGAVITLLMITGMTHRQSYRDIFAITCIKTVAVFVVIGFYMWTGLV